MTFRPYLQSLYDFAAEQKLFGRRWHRFLNSLISINKYLFFFLIFMIQAVPCKRLYCRLIKPKF